MKGYDSTCRQKYKLGEGKEGLFRVAILLILKVFKLDGKVGSDIIFIWRDTVCLSIRLFRKVTSKD